MKKALKIIALLLIFSVILCLCACGDKEPTNPGDQPTDEKEYARGISFVIPDGGGTFSAECKAGAKFIKIIGDGYITLTDEKNELAFITVTYHSREDSMTLAPTYLDKNVKTFKNLEFFGTVQVGEDGLYAEMVTGYDDTQYAEAYLIDTESGVLSVVISGEKNDNTLSDLRYMVENFKIA